MQFEAKSTPDALIFNGKAAHVANPWVIIIDTDNETITVRKANWYLIGEDQQILSFRFIRSIKVNQHIFGADVHIKVIGGTISAYCLSKYDVETIKNMLMQYNITKKGRSIIFS